MYFVYILQSNIKKKYYIGFTEDLDRRIAEHQNGHSVFDRTYRPFKVVLTEEYFSKKEAMSREKQIKSFKGGNLFNSLVGSTPLSGEVAGSNPVSRSEMNDERIPLHVVLVTAVIRNGDKFLISRRSYKDDQAAGQWSFPGGKIEITDGLNVVEDTLKREIREEVGVEINDMVVYMGSSGFVRHSGDHVISLTFVCEYKSGEAKPLEDQEEIKWLTLEEMLNLSDLPKFTKDWIEQVKKVVGK